MRTIQPAAGHRSTFESLEGEPSDPDTTLLTLDAQFERLAAELAAAQHANSKIETCPDQRPFARRAVSAPIEGDLCGQIEEILARLDPVERAILQTRACSVSGLGVKARHAAYVLSEYWEAPVDQLDWEKRTVRLLIDAICDVTSTHAPQLKV